MKFGVVRFPGSCEEMPPTPATAGSPGARIAPEPAPVAGPAPAPRPPARETPVAKPPAPPPPEPPTAASPEDFAQVEAATDRDAIAVAALSSMAPRFVRSALFAARPDRVNGWAAGGALDPARVRAISIPWTEGSVFLNVRLSRSFYLGPLLKLPRHEELAEALGSWPEECVVMPILIKEKPAGFFYAEAPPDRGVTPMDLVYLRELARAVSVAFARAIRLKKKEI